MQDGNKPDDNAPWQYSSEAGTAAPALTLDDPGIDTQQNEVDDDAKITWTASEYLAHDKSPAWYGMLAAGAVVVSAVTFIISHDWISTSVIAIAAIIMGIFAARKPRVLTYELDDHGIRIAGKPYDYSLFKSFTLLQEGGVPSVELMPLKRFMTPLTIYFDPEDAGDIIEVIAHFLPHEQRESPMVDRMMHRLRF